MDQQSIIHDLGVASKFYAATEVERRVAFLVNYLRSNGKKAYVLGISGLVDSLTTGLLAQLAVKQVRKMGNEARFIAVRLPYRIQRDEADAQASLM